MEIKNIDLFKEKALAYAASFNACCYFDSNGYKDKHGKIDCLIAFDIDKEIEQSYGNAFEQLKSFVLTNKDWMFGLLGYDLKNEIENFPSQKEDLLNFPDLYFFIPKNLIIIKGTDVSVLKGKDDLIDKIEEIDLTENKQIEKLPIQSKLSKEEYINAVNKLKNHIKRGDIYEVNFCQEFFATEAHMAPFSIYKQLKVVSPTPFSGFLKIRDKYILSATPERFLSKKDNTLVSQPIKGTAKRSEDFDEDNIIKQELRLSEKEQAENVMIVDLVRNDLTKSAVRGSVKVEELFGIYTFPQVHQMISTITCQLNPDVHFVDAIKNAFPMGSMTGAPKYSAMQLIDEFEKSKRGAYSGSMGYITPNGDFDFNVIIRSILYNAQSAYLSFQVGGAITYNSSAEKEYDECMLKASAILKVLNSKP
jgi:para-aminobenzoate synthetase component 1